MLTVRRKERSPAYEPVATGVNALHPRFGIPPDLKRFVECAFDTCLVSCVALSAMTPHERYAPEPYWTVGLL